MRDVIEWLESPEGEEWSFQRHRDSRSSYCPWFMTCTDQIRWYEYFGWEIEYAEGERELISAESRATA